MDRKEAWDCYVRYADNASTHARNLAFGGIGVCWVLKGQEPLPQILLHALGYFVCFFTADILQYVSGALMHRRWLRNEELRLWNDTRGPKSLEGDYVKPWWLDWPAFIFFMMKITLLLVAYLHAGLFIFGGIAKF